MAKIGLMGGTFNPIHTAHLMLAEFALDYAGLDEVWILPTGCSYMKKDARIVSGEDQLKMVELAILGNERLQSCDVEVFREGYTYTYETLENLNAQYPEHQFYFIFGADCLYTIESWKAPERIFQGCHILAAVRDDAAVSDMEQKIAQLKQLYQANISLLPFMQLGISSTMVRKRVQEEKSIRYLVPEAVREYIEEKGFYKDENC